MTRIYHSRRLQAMHAAHGVTEGRHCRECYYWHMMPLLCEQAPAGKRDNWAVNWKACGKWVSRKGET